MLGILLWNTQHMNDQNQSRPMSEAYAEKLSALDRALGAYKPLIVALFEVGTTASPNHKLVKDMSAREYVLKAVLSQEGGQSLNTTLGSMVFIHSSVSDRYTEAFKVPLQADARRATLLLEREGCLLGFCHANASRKSYGQIVEEIQFIAGYGTLIFFGGDLNCRASEANATLGLKGDRQLERRAPQDAGYTHVSVLSSIVLKQAKYREMVRNSGGFSHITEKDFVASDTDVYWGDIAVPSLLDFAYVEKEIASTAQCEAAVQVVSVKSRETRPLKTISDFKKDKVYEKVERLFMGEKLRSDHFPVYYALDLW